MKYLLTFLISTAIIAPVFADEAAPAATAPAEAPAADAAPATNALPAIFVSEPSYDFGNLDSTHTVTHDYVIVNKGSGTLEITQARPSCGCTVASISERSVPPGGESRITASLNLAGRSGQQHKTITVESNDPTQPQLTLTLQGNISEAVNVQPNQIILGQITSEANTTTDISISSGNDQTFKILTAESSSSSFTATTETKEEGKSYVVHVATKGPLEVGNLNATIHITTDSTVKPVIDVPVSAVVAGDLIVAPMDITLVEQPDQTVTRYVIVRSGSNKEFEMKNVEPPDPAITYQVFPFGVNGFRIQLDNIKPTKALDGKILKLTTSVETMKEIDVPFHVIAGS